MYDAKQPRKSSKQEDNGSRLAALEARKMQLKQEIADLETPETRLSALEMRKQQLKKEIADDEAALGNEAQRAQPTSDGLPPVKDVDRPWSEALVRQGARGLTDLSIGLGEVADFPNVVAMGLHAAGRKKTPEFYPSIGQKLEKKYTERTKGYLRPENKAEEYASTATRAVAPFLLAPFTGGASLTGTLARALTKKGAEKGVAAKLAKWGANTYKPTAANIGGAFGASGATKYYIDDKIENNENPGFWPMIAASVIGGTGGRAAANYKQVAAKTLGVATRFNPEEFAKQIKMGYLPSLSSTSKSMTPARFENFLSNLPFHEGSFNKFYQKQRAALAKNLGFRDPEDLKHIALNPAEDLAIEGAQGYVNRADQHFKNRERNFAGREWSAINNKELVDVSDIVHRLTKKRNRSPSNDARLDFDTTPDGVLRQKLINYSYLDADEIAKGAKKGAKEGPKGAKGPKEPKEAKTKGKKEAKEETKVSYSDLDDLRKEALEESLRLRTPLGAGTDASKEASARSGMLGNKRHEFINKTGTPFEAHNSREAKKFYSRFRRPKKGGYDIAEDITGAADDSAAFGKLLTKEGAINVVRQGLSKEQLPRFFESIMSKLGKQGDTININATQRRYSDLKPAIRKDLLKTIKDKNQRKNFERTMDFIGENKAKLNKIINTSHTTDKAEFIHYVKKYGKLLGGLAAGSGAAYLSLGPTLFGLAATKTVSKLWTNQKFLKHVNETMKKSTPEMRDNSLKAVIQALTLANKEALRRKAEHK
jgi:hypothetical protein